MFNTLTWTSWSEKGILLFYMSREHRHGYVLGFVFLSMFQPYLGLSDEMSLYTYILVIFCPLAVLSVPTNLPYYLWTFGSLGTFPLLIPTVYEQITGRYCLPLCLPHPWPWPRCQSIRYKFYRMLLLTHEASMTGFLNLVTQQSLFLMSLFHFVV